MFEMQCLRQNISKGAKLFLLRGPRQPHLFVGSPPYAHHLSTLSRCTPRVTFSHRNDFLSARNHSISTFSAVLLPPVVFAGLIVSLWTWKCFMMVLLQNKIIYMPFLPPNARSDTIAEYSKQCSGLKWREEHIKSRDGTDIALAVTEVGSQEEDAVGKIVLYFQGNASSLPPRLPDISQVLRMALKDNPSLHLKLIGVSYRGYWNSSGKPSELGMQQDAEAALQYSLANHASSSSPKIIIWGQSIGCTFASHLAARMMENPSGLLAKNADVQLETLILETPFTSASEMLKTLYPQKWLPYRYLSVFLWNRLDTVGNLERVMRAGGDQNSVPNVVVLEGGKDELVPREHGDEIEMMLKNGERGTRRFRRVTVAGALHTQVLAKGSGRIAAAKAVRGC